MNKYSRLLFNVFSINKFNPHLLNTNVISINTRHFHVSSVINAKCYHDNENNHAYNLMILNGYGLKFNFDDFKSSNDNDDISEILEKKMYKESSSNLYNMFHVISSYCANKNVCISNPIFDDFIDSLTDNIQYLSDDEIKSIFYLLKKIPETESLRTRNFIEIWAALDDECHKRMKDWSFDKMLSFMSLMYMLNLTRSSDFSHKCLQKLASKAKQLTTHQLVQTLFFVGILRKSPFDMHNLEVHLENNFTNFTLDELAIISMGFFKSQTPIRNVKLITDIVHMIIKNSHTIHEISLAALLKIIRYSMKLNIDNSIYRLLDTLQFQVNRFSVMCCVHIALLGTATLTFHQECLNQIANSVVNNISNARMKDLERLTFAFGTFNFIPQTTPPFFESVLNELRNPERSKEIDKYGRSFASCVAYMSFVGIYPLDLINRILDEKFLNQFYKKGIYTYGREILTVHNIVEIFFNDKDVNRLNSKTVSILAKKYTDYVPNEKYQKHFNISEQMMIDVIQNLKKSRGDDYVIADHIICHYQRGGRFS